MERLWRFSAIDTWFFRDSIPFEAGEGGRAGLTSVFPPTMFTLQGALRTALALGQGWDATWNYRDKSTAKFPEELGSSEDLGPLVLQGPYLRYDGKRLYPLPRHVLYAKDFDGAVREFVPLVPDSKPVRCDLSAGFGREVRLLKPRGKQKDLKEGDGIFVTGEAMTRILREGLLDAKSDKAEKPLWYLGDKLWSTEVRTGLERDPRTHLAKEHYLYSTVQVRPAADLELEVWESGAPPGWAEKISHFIRLGGEGRMAEVQAGQASPEEMPKLPFLKRQGGKIRFTLTLITPGFYDHPEKVVRQGPPGVPGEVISASIGKLVTVGGWNLATGRPRPVQPMLPSGCTWFYEAETDEENRIKELHGLCLSDRDLWVSFGFGQVLVGTWSGNEEE